MKDFFRHISIDELNRNIIQWHKAPRKIGVPINLQRFADEGEKTEKATHKKRQDARKKGQVLQSREISSTLVLLLVFVSLRILGPYMYREISAFIRFTYLEYALIPDLTLPNEVMRITRQTIIEIVKIIGPIFAVAVGVGLTVSYAQVGALFTMEPLKPQFSKLNPMKGLKRIFSVKGIVELLKSLFKISIVGGIAYSSLKAEQVNFMKLMDVDVVQIAGYVCKTSIDIAIKICAVMILIAVLDYAYQWWQYEKDLKMTKQEIKEEYKQTEGNPEIKSKIKQKQREISMRRMLTDVPKADVVITNPTHYAIAIRYDTSKSPAPIVTAKGQDYIALRIKEIAKENGVETVENKPLAQTLYKTVDIGQSIPPELYQAVAEILAFVYSLKDKQPATV